MCCGGTCWLLNTNLLYTFRRKRACSIVGHALCVLAGCISRVLCRSEERCLSFIYDCSCLQPQATYPSTSDEQPYIRRYTWSCTPWDVQPECVTTSAVGSYPAFSPLPELAPGRLFSVTLCHALTNIFPLESTVLCVARTFLLSPEGDRRQTLPA